MTTTYVGRRVSAPVVAVRRQPLSLKLPILILWFVVKYTALFLWACLRSPAALFGLVLLALGAFGYYVGGSRFGFVIVATTYVWLFFACLLVWLNILPVRSYVRARMRRFWIYQHRWRVTMEFAGLNRTRKSGRAYEPPLGKVTCTVAGDHFKQKLAGVMKSSVDRVQVRMLAGQTIEDWAKVSDRLCQTFGAVDCRVASVPGRPHDVQLSFLLSDPLQAEVSPCYATDDLSALPVALREDGDWFKLKLFGTHLLLTGATDAGKSEALWAIINQLRSNVANGTCQIWALDAKGGMELAFGEPMFARFVHGGSDMGPAFEAEFAEALEDAVFVMRERQAALRGRTRKHTPTLAEPYIVIVIDELAALTGYVTDRQIKARISAALSLLLSQGRAVGITVLAAIQDPRKETLPARDLFPTRIVLRVTEAEHVALVMGPGARDRGAKADQIPTSLPGVAYVDVDGVPEPVRVRFAHITDTYIGANFRYPEPVSLSLVPAPANALVAAPEAA